MKKILTFLLFVSLSCNIAIAKDNDKSTIYLAGGCYWGLEHFIKQINGVIDTKVGGVNGVDKIMRDGSKKYKGGAETVMVTYNPEILPLEKLLELFYMTIDPTTLNRQGEDVGIGYRTGIYYLNKKDLKVVNKPLKNLSESYSSPILIEVMEMTRFVPSAESSQDYLDKTPNGYCRFDRNLFDVAKKAN